MINNYLVSIDEFSAFTGVRLSPRLFAAYEVMFTFQYDRYITRNDIDNALGDSSGSQLITRPKRDLNDKKLIERSSKGVYLNLTHPGAQTDVLAAHVATMIKGKREFAITDVQGSINTANWLSLLPKAFARMIELGKIDEVSKGVYANLELQEGDSLFEVTTV